jgi:hypothetical protein
MPGQVAWLRPPNALGLARVGECAVGDLQLEVLGDLVLVDHPTGALADRAGVGCVEATAGVGDRCCDLVQLALGRDEQLLAFAGALEQIAEEAALDGLYVLRTTCPAEQPTTHAVVRVYKQLKMAERAYRTIKDALDVRPIRHHLQDRVQAHFFLFLLAYYLLFELQARLAPMLYTDDTPLSPADPVAPARRSPAANTKAGSHRTPDGLPAYNLADLITELGTVFRNQLRIGDSQHTFPRLTNTNPLQTKALELLNVKLGK